MDRILFRFGCCLLSMVGSRVLVAEMKSIYTELEAGVDSIVRHRRYLSESHRNRYESFCFTACRRACSALFQRPFGRPLVALKRVNRSTSDQPNVSHFGDSLASPRKSSQQRLTHTPEYKNNAVAHNSSTLRLQDLEFCPYPESMSRP